MSDPRTQYLIYKEQESNLMLQIERKLAAQERDKFVETSQPWYSAPEQWLKEKVFSFRLRKQPCIAEEEPC